MVNVREKIKQYFTGRIVLILFIVLTSIMIIWIYTFYVSLDAYKTGKSYHDEKNYIKAVTYFDRSLHAYTPFNPFIEKSAEHLWSIGENALNSGDQELALIAFRTIRRGFYSANNLYQPGVDWIERCNLKINSIISERLNSEKTLNGYTNWDGKIPDGQVFRSPNVFWTLVLEIGLIGWIFTVVCFILDKYRGNKVNDKLAIIKYLGGAFLFFALWILGMMKV